MKLNMPMAVFGGLALIAAAIYFGPGSQPVSAAGGVQKIAICESTGTWCADILTFPIIKEHLTHWKTLLLYLRTSPHK